MIGSTAMHVYPGCYALLGHRPLPAAPAAPACYHCRDKGTVAVRLSGGRVDTMPCPRCAAGELWAYRQYCSDRVAIHLPVRGYARWLAGELRASRRWQERVMNSLLHDYADARAEQQYAHGL